MRIYGNRILKTLPGQLTRPTSSKVREALFNIWQNSIRESAWLDLCAGNGSMGAEALCRGVKEAIAIEQNGKACSIIRENWEKIATPEQQITIIRGDVLSKLKTLTGKQFDHIYFDPPYNSNLYQPVLEILVQYQLLSIGGEIAVEHNAKLWEAIPIAGLTLCREKHYGHTNLTFYTL